MGIPSPLSFPPTALRNVAAGLVVGNPIGSGGTRGKALTAAELKAIVEASGISYLPLSGGTMTGALSLGSNQLTCGALTSSGNVIQDLASATTSDKQISLRLAGVEQTYYTHKYDSVVQGPALLLGGSIVVGAAAGSHGYVGRPDSVTALVLLNGLGIATASSQFIGWGSTNNPMRDPGSSWADLKLYRSAANAMAQRNGINAQCFLLSKTYTSDASQEAFMWDAAKQISGKLGLYSYRGTSGGSNYPIQIGMLAADGSTFSGMIVSTDGTTQIILPTSDPHVVGVLWNNSGTITISAG